MSEEKSKGGIFTVLIIVIILVVAVVAAFLIIKNQNQEEEKQIIGGERDEHGCLGPAGYSWCEAKQKCLRTWEESCEDVLFKTLKDLEETMELDFSEAVFADLKWQMPGEQEVVELTLSGWVTGVDEVTNHQVAAMERFFENNGFEVDEYNVSAAVPGSTTGYYHNNFMLACTLNSIFSDFDPDNLEYEPQVDTHNVKVTCAILESSMLPEISMEKQIQELFAKKYDKKVSAISLTVNQETENYVRGGVTFLDSEIAGQPEGGLFLAAKVDDQWQLVFDGNGGISCQLVEPYGFPEEMITDCFDSK